MLVIFPIGMSYNIDSNTFEFCTYVSEPRRIKIREHEKPKRGMCSSNDTTA
jgi:hypothetical protein